MNPLYNINASSAYTKCECMHSQCPSNAHENDMETRSQSSTYFRPWDGQENEATTPTTTQSLVDQVTHRNRHTQYTAHRVENMVGQPTNSNIMTTIPTTTTIPPASMAAIQQSVANAAPLLPPPTVSPYDERFNMDMMQYYAQPLFMGAAANLATYPTNYNASNPYLYNMPHQQYQQGAPYMSYTPGYNPLPYTTMPTNSVAGYYYQPNVAAPWSNLPYSNSMAAQYLQNQIYPTALQQNMYNVPQGPSSAPLPTSAHYNAVKPTTAGLSKAQSCSTNGLYSYDSTTWNTQAHQQNMVNQTRCPEVQVPSISTRTGNKPKSARSNRARQTKQVSNPVAPTKVPAVPEITKLLKEEAPSDYQTTKRKSVDELQAETPSSAKKLKMICSALKLNDILAYRPNMARNRPKKHESKEEQLAREQNTIACRKYRRMRRIAKIMEQKLIEAESASQFANII